MAETPTCLPAKWNRPVIVVADRIPTPQSETAELEPPAVSLPRPYSTARPDHAARTHDKFRERWRSEIPRFRCCLASGDGGRWGRENRSGPALWSDPSRCARKRSGDARIETRSTTDASRTGPLTSCRVRAEDRRAILRDIRKPLMPFSRWTFRTTTQATEDIDCLSSEVARRLEGGKWAPLQRWAGLVVPGGPHCQRQVFEYERR